MRVVRQSGGRRGQSVGGRGTNHGASTSTSRVSGKKRGCGCGRG